MYQEPILMRNYGRILQNIVKYACTLDQQQQDEIIEHIVSVMITRNQQWNREQASSAARIVSDLASLSGNRIMVSEQAVSEMMERK